MSFESNFSYGPLVQPTSMAQTYSQSSSGNLNENQLGHELVGQNAILNPNFYTTQNSQRCLQPSASMDSLVSNESFTSFTDQHEFQEYENQPTQAPPQQSFSQTLPYPLNTSYPVRRATYQYDSSSSSGYYPAQALPAQLTGALQTQTSAPFPVSYMPLDPSTYTFPAAPIYYTQSQAPTSRVLPSQRSHTMYHGCGGASASANPYNAHLIPHYPAVNPSHRVSHPRPTSSRTPTPSSPPPPNPTQTRRTRRTPYPRSKRSKPAVSKSSDPSKFFLTHTELQFIFGSPSVLCRVYNCSTLLFSVDEARDHLSRVHMIKKGNHRQVEKTKCPWDGCEKEVGIQFRHVMEHMSVAHCPVNGCAAPVKVFTRKEGVKNHLSGHHEERLDEDEVLDVVILYDFERPGVPRPNTK
ncbi:hypothetical protein CPC08DRAFT_817188 [Agrocybe pediades]|nr:hypothetical protein CPC08DRAFT_817188 [Agrocybe pediades]